MIRPVKTLFVMIAIAGSTSFAGITLEPLIAYQAGKVNDGPIVGKSTLNGATFGGKVGMPLNKMFSVGLDGSYATLEQEYTSAPRVLYPATQQQLGLFAAADFLAFRALASFLFLNQVSFSTRDEVLRGTALKLGLGVPVISSVRVNVDYVIHYFQDAGSGNILPVDASTVMLSISYLLSTKD